MCFLLFERWPARQVVVLSSLERVVPTARPQSQPKAPTGCAEPCQRLESNGHNKRLHALARLVGADPVRATPGLWAGIRGAHHLHRTGPAFSKKLGRYVAPPRYLRCMIPSGVFQICFYHDRRDGEVE